MPQLLIEVCRKGSPVLLESTKRPGCLGRFELICCDYENDTENGRFYSEALWEKASAPDSKMMKRIQNKICFGELDHPTDRLDSQLKCSAVNMVEFRKNPKDKTYVGVFDILDTPYGQMVKTYLDYGARLGVSSRGAGDIDMMEGRSCVNEETYDWEAFDVVLDPAVAKSKSHVLESKHSGLTLSESLVKIIEECANPYELTMLKSLIESTEVPDRDSILESLDNKLSSLDSEGGATLSKLTEDLEKSIEKVTELEGANAELTKDLAASATRVGVLEGTVSSLKSANLKMRVSATKQTKQYNETVEKLKGSLSEARSALEVRGDQISRLRTENSTLRSQNASKDGEIRTINSQLSEARNELNKSRSSLTESRTTTANHESALAESTKTIKKHEATIEKLEANVKSLSESSASILSSYIRRVASIYSVDAKELASRVKLEGKMTAEAVDAIAESMRSQSDRLNLLPFDITKGNVVNESVVRDTKNPELDRAARFAKAVKNRNN